MRYSSKNWRDAPQKHILLFSMSGLGKSYLSSRLRSYGNWYHYSVDYRIGTYYMGEHIVDLCKKQAMQNPFLASLLRSNSIYISSNITFDNLEPLSAFLGKPGDPQKGGIEIEEYKRRQRLHCNAEHSAMMDSLHFLERSKSLYNYAHFICDTSGSLVEVIDPDNPNDAIMSKLSASFLPVWIKGSEEDTHNLAARFDAHPKPMYYNPEFLSALWEEYHSKRAGAVDPNHFIRWGYDKLIAYRQPRYAKIAKRWGVTVASKDVAAVKNEAGFIALVEEALQKKEAQNAN